MSDTIRHDPTLSELSPAQAKVILALVEGATVSKAAQAAGIHRSTVHDWLKRDPRFAAALRHSRAEYAETLRDEMKELSALALTTLRALLEDPSTSAAVRLRAALAILERPRLPEPGWTLPTSLSTPREDEFRRDFAALEVEMKALQMETALPCAATEDEIPPHAPAARSAHRT